MPHQWNGLQASALAGLVDLVLSSRNPLAVQWYMLIVQGVVFAVIYYVLFRTVIRLFNLKTPGREEKIVSRCQLKPRSEQAVESILPRE